MRQVALKKFIVEFEILDSEKGPQAVKVKIIEQTPRQRSKKPELYKRRPF